MQTIKNSHISEEPFTLTTWYLHIHWVKTTFVVLVPVCGFIQALWTPLHFKTAIWAGIYLLFTGSSITAGYHRLFAHRSYSASVPLKIFLAVTGAGAVQGSIKNWCREHRAHHRYTDTDQDPYSVHKGILHAHILWIVLKQPNTVGRVDISDLKRDPIVVWQNTFFVPLALFMGWIFPTLIAGIFWNDWKGGFIYAGILRLFLVHQSTFCVNSLAHYLGDQPFSDRHSSRDHLFTSIVTLGEGYHNFHHEFPSDYRNGIEWHNIDISKWTIWIFDRVGLAWDLKRFGQNEIEKSRIQQLRKMVDRREKKIDWGTPISQLPVFEWREYQERIKEGYLLIAIEGVIYDITHFVKTHPGGESIIRSGIGKDGTALFNGGVYDHSDAARNFLSSMRLAKLRGGCEVEVWK